MAENGNRTLRADIGRGYRTVCSIDGREIVADEPESMGGTDEGPTPIQMLLASLASCMLITVRMYAARKEWPLEGASLELRPEFERPSVPRITRIGATLTLRGELSEEQRRRILEISHACPVHRALSAGIDIETDLA